MKLGEIVGWLDRELKVGEFGGDVSNNGLQLTRSGDGEITKVYFAVDASLKAVNEAVSEGAELLVVHHGISWGGGIRRLDGGVYEVVRAAIAGNLAIYAAHLPLDAHPTLGNNAGLAKLLGLKNLKPAFEYHGYLIGFIGDSPKAHRVKIGECEYDICRGKVGVCSGGAGEFAEAAKKLGCDLYLTGEANWGDVIAAENCGMKMIAAGHYETETFGVSSLAEAMRRKFNFS